MNNLLTKGMKPMSDEKCQKFVSDIKEILKERMKPTPDEKCQKLVSDIKEILKEHLNNNFSVTIDGDCEHELSISIYRIRLDDDMIKQLPENAYPFSPQIAASFDFNVRGYSLTNDLQLDIRDFAMIAEESFAVISTREERKSPAWLVQDKSSKLFVAPPLRLVEPVRTRWTEDAQAAQAFDTEEQAMDCLRRPHVNVPEKNLQIIATIRTEEYDVLYEYRWDCWVKLDQIKPFNKTVSYEVKR
jgi:hypothetical protein